MFTHPTLDLLADLGLHGMAKGFRDLADNPEAAFEFGPDVTGFDFEFADHHFEITAAGNIFGVEHRGGRIPAGVGERVVE